MVSVEGCWDKRIQDLQTEERKLRSRRLNNSEQKSLRLYSWRFHEYSHEGARVWSSGGFSRMPEELDTGLIPRSSGQGTYSSGAEGAQAARAAWGGGGYKAARGAVREQGRSKTGTASLPHVKLAPMRAPGATGERQEHLDAVIPFAGAGQRRRLFRGLDILTIKWAGRPLQKYLMTMEWIRSLAEAQEITAGRPGRKCHV